MAAKAAMRRVAAAVAGVVAASVLAACGAAPPAAPVLNFYTPADGATQYAAAAADCTVASAGRYTIVQRTLPKER